MKEPDPRMRATVLAWALFVIGLALQWASPHLTIAHDSFVIPAELSRHGASIDPRALVVRERLVQLSSAALVLAGALILALLYRKTFYTCFFPQLISTNKKDAQA